MIITRAAPFLGIVLSLALATPARAHHVMGGKLPSSFLDGLLSGIGHPVIGLDHLAAVIAVGLLVSLSQRALTLCAVFFAATLAGVALHVGHIDLPGTVAWGLVAGTAGVALWATQTASARATLVTALLIAAGGLHGYAYGESIVGAQPGPLVAYLLGLTMIQAALASCVGVIARSLLRRDRFLARPVWLAGGAGLVAANVAVVLFNTAA